MKLLLDQGNSRLKWLLVAENGKFLARGASDADCLPDDFCGGQRGAPLDVIALGSVASKERRQALCEYLSRTYGVSPVLVSTRKEWAGLHNGYADAARLGVDRWLAMLGARQLGTNAWLVVDAGTALTLDAVNASGVHLGGYIVPGYAMQLSMLAKDTAAVGRSAVVAGTGWGRDTDSAVANGVRLSMIALIERALVELSNGLQDTCRVAITGGDAPMLASGLSCDPVMDADLVFRGMLSALSAVR